MDPVTDASGFPYRPSFDEDSAGAPGLFRVDADTSPCGSEDATPGSRACVRVLVRPGRGGRAGLLGAFWCPSPFPLAALSFCFARPPPGWGCLFFRSLVAYPPPRFVFFPSLCFLSICAPLVSFFLWFPDPGALGVGALFFFPPPPAWVFSFFLFSSSFCAPCSLWPSLVSGPGCPGPWRCVLFVLLASRSSALSALSPLLRFLLGRWLLPRGCCPPPPPLRVSRFSSLPLCVPSFFFSFAVCAPNFSGFHWFPAPVALGLGAVCCLFCWPPASWLSVRSRLFCVSCPALGFSLVVAAPPPPCCVSWFLSLSLLPRWFFFCAPPLSLALFGFRPRPSWALALCVVCFAGLSLLGSQCARASFLLPARPLAASSWLLPPPPFLCLAVFVAACFFLLLVGRSRRLPHAPARCVRGCCPPCCVPCCGTSPCCNVGCYALCGVCWGVCLCVVLRCWLLLRVVPCLWSCRPVELFAVWLAALFWSALPCAVLCCLPLGAVLRRAAACRATRCCPVVCCIVLLCLFGVTGCCAVSSGAARRPGALCFAALCFAVFPRAVCSVLCVFCRGVLVRAVVRRCAVCCVCPGVSRCAFPVLSALCGAVFRSAGALASCCSCGACCCWRLVLWCAAVCCAVSFGVL